jgi:hypothetical protein
MINEITAPCGQVAMLANNTFSCLTGGDQSPTGASPYRCSTTLQLLEAHVTGIGYVY